MEQIERPENTCDLDISKEIYSRLYNFVTPMIGEYHNEIYGALLGMFSFFITINAQRHSQTLTQELDDTIEAIKQRIYMFEEFGGKKE